MVSAPLFGVERLRMGVDGNGVRTLVCFAGCPLNCKHCINEESKTVASDSVLVTTEQLIKRLSVDSLYFRATNGGVTFGGGEPLLRVDFINEFIDNANSEWNYWIETSLNVPYENIELIKDKIERFVIDIKSINNSIYRSYTDMDNGVVISIFLARDVNPHYFKGILYGIVAYIADNLHEMLAVGIQLQVIRNYLQGYFKRFLSPQPLFLHYVGKYLLQVKFFLVESECLSPLHACG